MRFCRKAKTHLLQVVKYSVYVASSYYHTIPQIAIFKYLIIPIISAPPVLQWKHPNIGGADNEPKQREENCGQVICFAGFPLCQCRPKARSHDRGHNGILPKQGIWKYQHQNCVERCLRFPEQCAFNFAGVQNRGSAHRFPSKSSSKKSGVKTGRKI